MKKNIKTDKNGPRKTWGGVTNEHWEYLKADGEKNRSKVTVWRSRQDQLVEMAKKMLASKLDFIQLREDACDTEETNYKISDQLLADYYNARFPEREISADTLQRARSIQKRYAENPSVIAGGNDGAHSLHFDEAYNLAQIADVAFIPVDETDIRSAIKTKDLTTLLGIILDMIQNVVDDTREVVNADGAEIKRTGVLHVLLCYIDEYARKLIHAEQDDMADGEIYSRREDLRDLERELEMAVENYSLMVGPQQMMCMSMLNSMQTTVSMLIEKTDFEAVIRDIRANGDRQDEEEAFRKIEGVLKDYCNRISGNRSLDEDYDDLKTEAIEQLMDDPDIREEAIERLEEDEWKLREAEAEGRAEYENDYL